MLDVAELITTIIGLITARKIVGKIDDARRRHGVPFAFLPTEIFMSNELVFAILLAVAIGGAAIYWIAYQFGRLHGYHLGLEHGAKSTSQVQHLKGMTDGYVMSLQHTPEQRNEYMNNVLVRVGAITPADVEADRQRRLQLQQLA